MHRLELLAAFAAVALTATPGWPAEKDKPASGAAVKRVVKRINDKAASRAIVKRAMERIEEGLWWSSAIDDFEKALELDPDNLEAFVLLCKAYRWEAEGAPDSTLVWLGRHAHKDCGWSFACEAKDAPRFANPGTDPSRSKATALAALTFLGAGYCKLGSGYCHEVQGGVDFLGSEMKLTDRGGDLRGERGDMIAHALATLVFSSLVKMRDDQRLSARARPPCGSSSSPSTRTEGGACSRGRPAT